MFSYALTSSYWLIFKLILLSESGEKINNTITKDLPPHPDIVAVKCQCLQSNNWKRDDFWKFENWSIFDELKAYEKMPIPVRDSLALFATQHRATYHDDCEQHCVDPRRCATPVVTVTSRWTPLTAWLILAVIHYYYYYCLSYNNPERPGITESIKSL